MIHVKDLSVENRLLPMSFQCDKGQVVHIIGPNGSGKSTLLSALAGVLSAKGEILFGNRLMSDMALSDLALVRAYMSQSERPAFNMMVFHFLSMSVPNLPDIDAKQVDATLSEVTQLLNVSALLHRTVHQLSGGEWQRVRLAAMCLQVWPALNPYSRLLILDEPSAPLDIGQERYLQQMITQLAKQGLTVVVANHNLNVTLNQADQVILLNKGVAIASGTPTAVLLPDVLSTIYDAEVELTQVNGKPMLLFNGTL